MHAISSYRGNRPANTQTYTPTHPQTGPITIHCATKLSAQCKYDILRSWACVSRVYQQMETLGLFLFNDTLVVTVRTNSHVPFERCVEHIYTFDTCAVLSRLVVEDVPNSKC